MLEKVAALKVERMEISELKPHPRNPRKHPKAGSPKWQALVTSLEHDYFDPLVFNCRNGMLVSGHFRQKVLSAAGFTHADVSIVDYDEATHYARLIAANNLLGEWEEELLSALAGDLENAGLAAGLACLSEKQFAALLEEPSIDDDTSHALVLVSQAEELQARWKVQQGDLFAAADHRILCGDCTDAANWKRLLGDQLADMVWTDPPYNVDYDSIQRRRLELKASAGTRAKPESILNDDLTDEAYAELLRASLTAAFQFTKPGGAIYVAHADSQGLVTRQSFAAAGWNLAQCLIWVKSAFTLGRQDYQWQHEPVLYGWRPGSAHYWQGGYTRSTVIDDEAIDFAKATKPELIAIINRLRNDRETTIIREPRNSGCSLHPTIKPLGLVARQIWNSSRKGDTVLELFGGSGTTILAAHQTGRRAVATELDPKFCAVILERLSRAGVRPELLKPDGNRT